MEDVFVASKQACRLYGITVATLRKWADQGKVPYKRTFGNQRVYNVAHLVCSAKQEVPSPVSDIERTYLYTRVSSAKQRDDLERQVAYLESKYPGATTIKDVGSALNFKRRGLLTILERCKEGKVDTVVVASKDRLCRFGFDMLEWIFRQYDVQLVVLDRSDKSPEQEFTEDILAILQVFACRWNGKRKYTVTNKKGEVEVDISPKETVS